MQLFTGSCCQDRQSLRCVANDNVLVKNLGIYYNYSQAEIELVIETSTRLLEGSGRARV